MAIFQRSKRRRYGREPGHHNWMGGRSFEITDPVARLRIMAASCLFGEPMYYHRDDDAAPARGSLAARPYALTDADLKHLRDTLHAVDQLHGQLRGQFHQLHGQLHGQFHGAADATANLRALSPAALLEHAIDEALDTDPDATLREAARLRLEDHIRTTPQVILVRAANHPAVRGTGLVRRHAREIIARADEPAVGLAYQLWRYGKPIPNALKKAWRDALTRADGYQLAKYRLASRAVHTADVINLVHPASDAVGKLARGELLTTGRTWESIVSAGGSTRESWTEAVAVMGHMALLRNLRNLLAAGVDPGVFVDALVSGARTGKQLPFRYYSAHRAVSQAASTRGDWPASATATRAVLSALEACLQQSLGNLPRFPGRVMALCDNSGSAQGTTTSSMGRMQISTIANLTGVLAGMCSDDGHLGVFGDRLETFAVRPDERVFAQLDRAEGLARRIGGATENGIWLFWDRAIRERQQWDAVFVFSDMQAGHGGLYGQNPRDYRDFAWRGDGRYIDVARLVAAYRDRVNPDVDVFLVQVAGYRDTLLPEVYDRTYILGGWSDGLLRYAARMRELRAQPCAVA